MNIENILKFVQENKMTIDQAKKELDTYEDLGFAKIDHHRKKRKGFPEVVFGEGKTYEHIIEIVSSIKNNGSEILITRLSKEKAKKVSEIHKELKYNEVARVMYSEPNKSNKKNEGSIAIICAGTSDFSVAEEAAITAEIFGNNVQKHYDVGVAGIHRLLDKIPEINQATVSVVIAGMEGALPSVIGGLVSHPIIAVPTSIGYGSNFNGLSALLTMLNSCSSGISVVNIDNGFGGAYSASLINKLVNDNRKRDDKN